MTHKPTELPKSNCHNQGMQAMNGIIDLVLSDYMLHPRVREHAIEALHTALKQAGFVIMSIEPTDTMIEGDDREIERLQSLVQVLLDNEPDDPIADGGYTVFQLWREEARAALKGQP